MKLIMARAMVFHVTRVGSASHVTSFIFLFLCNGILNSFR